MLAALYPSVDFAFEGADFPDAFGAAAVARFATLKAMGATGRELNTVILGQAVINAGAGFAIAVLLALLSKSPLEETGITLAVDLKLVSFLLVLTLAIAIAAAYFSIRRVRTLDPAIIFRS